MPARQNLRRWRENFFAKSKVKAFGCKIISDPGVIPVKFRAPGGTVCEIVPKGRECILLLQRR